LKKKARDRLIRLAQTHADWVLGFQDETWWSRLSQPNLHTWSKQPWPLQELALDKSDRNPKALSCYGLLRADTGGMLLRFVVGRPVSQVTEDYLAWLSSELHKAGKKALLLVWDNAPWHVSKRVKQWLKEHNRAVKQGQRAGVRLVVCHLPIKSPWLNAIEPKWVHGKRAIVEPDRILSGDEIQQRVCDYYGCPCEKPLVQSKEK
jgi:DDE superfamily endonuclease